MKGPPAKNAKPEELCQQPSGQKRVGQRPAGQECPSRRPSGLQPSGREPAGQEPCGEQHSGQKPSPEIWERPPFSVDSPAIAQAAAAWPLPKDADLETFFDDTRERLDAAGRCQRTHRRIYRFVTRHSVEEESYVQVVWSPWYRSPSHGPRG